MNSILLFIFSCFPFHVFVLSFLYIKWKNSNLAWILNVMTEPHFKVQFGIVMLLSKVVHKLLRIICHFLKEKQSEIP